MPDESITIEAYREMKKYYDSAYSKITEIFSGFLHSSISCSDPSCGYSSNKFDPFLHLSLPIPCSLFGMQITIEDCMNEYCKKEILDEDNLWLCEGCNKKVKGIKKLQLWEAPPVLVIQIKRFNVEQGSKDNRLIKYPIEHLDIGSIISSIQCDPSRCTKYRLQCVINHTGNLNGGHYYTYCLDDDTDEWYEFNDESVHKVKNNSIISHTAYLLFYTREDIIR